MVYKWSGCKFTADQYAVYKWLGRKFCPPPAWVEDFFYQRMGVHEESRILYNQKIQFFDDMDEPYLKGNKKGNRPHYYCFEDAASGLYWMIPLSSRIDKKMVSI